MEAWFNAHVLQIAGVVIGLILLPGSNFAVSRANDHPVLLWFAFIVRLGIGLIFGASLFQFISWLTDLPGTFGGIVSGIGAIIAVLGGWLALTMIVPAFRDLGDGKPDADARKAALWVPILAPATVSAAWNVVMHPRGIGTGITAAIIALISVVALRKIVTSCLKPSKHTLFWKWAASVISLIGGIIMIPLVAFADQQVARYASGPVATLFRLTLAAVGLTLLVGAIADAWPKKEKNEKSIVPDGWVRAFAAYGVPVLFLFGALGIGFISDRTAEQGNVMLGSVGK